MRVAAVSRKRRRPTRLVREHLAGFLDAARQREGEGYRLAPISDPPVVTRILTPLGLAADPPATASAGDRGPGRAETSTSDPGLAGATDPVPYVDLDERVGEVEWEGCMEAVDDRPVDPPWNDDEAPP